MAKKERFPNPREDWLKYLGPSDLDIIRSADRGERHPSCSTYKATDSMAAKLVKAAKAKHEKQLDADAAAAAAELEEVS